MATIYAYGQAGLGIAGSQGLKKLVSEAPEQALQALKLG